MNTNYAGFWLRFVAVIIDAIIVGVAQSLIIVPILGVMGFNFATNLQNGDMTEAETVGMIAGMMATMGTTMLISGIIGIIYYVLMETSKYQGTIGKIALGLKVTDMNGDKLDISKSLIRNLGKIISGIILYVGYMMAGFTEKKQALHDIIANTLVVKK